MNDTVPTSSPAPVALECTGEVILVSREEVQFLATETIGEGDSAQTVTRLITITNLGDPRSRTLAQRYGESMPCVIRFG